jgi:glycosyltransferase involved in cell wall biosynthesis
VKVLVLGIRGIAGVQGGVETHARHLYARLAGLGCDVEAIVRSSFAPRGEPAPPGMRIRRLWSPRRAGVEALVHSLLGVLYAGIVRPDILHIHSIGPAIVTPLARLMGLKVVVTFHSQNYDHEKWGPLARWLLRAGERVGARYANAGIAVSQTLRDVIETRYQRNVRLIHNGVPVPDVRRDDEHLKRLGLQSGRYILHVGRISPEKRQLDLLAAFSAAALAGWRLVLVGDLGDDQYSLAVKHSAAETNAVLTGFLSGVPLAQLYSHAGGFAFPSSHEGLPIALLEAISYGLPVAASDIAANREVGLCRECYFKVGDQAQLQAALQNLVARPPDSAVRAASRERIIGEYDWERAAKATLAVYRSVTAVGSG